MAMTPQISTQRSAVANPLAFVEVLMNRFSRYKMYRRTLNELSALSDRELADLGLNRSGLRRMAYQAAYDVN